MTQKTQFQFTGVLLLIILLVGGSLVSITKGQQTGSDSNRVTQKLAYAHFVPLTNSPGNQIKLVMNFTVEDSSVLNKPINAIMEVYDAKNGSLIRTSSFPEPVIANKSGTIELATTFKDENMNNATAKARLTGAGKMLTLSNTVAVDLRLGQIIER